MDNEEKKLVLTEWIDKILDYFTEIGFEYEPMPEVILDDSENDDDDLFIRTGYYAPDSNELHLFIDGRHIKDILRTFCHEMVHRNQAIKDPNFGQETSDKPLAEDPVLKKIEGEAFLYGNYLFRGFTEQYTHQGKKQMNESRKPSKREIQEQAQKYKDDLSEKIDHVNQSFIWALNDIEKEYGISVEHDLNNNQEVYVDEKGEIGGYYELVSSDQQREYARRFSEYEGEVEKSDKESLKDLKDAAQIMRDILTKETADFGINCKVNATISQSNGYQKAKFNIILDEKPPKEIQDALIELHEKEYRKSRRRYGW